MSIGFGKSFQYAGLNRAGKFLEPAREKGPSLADRNVCPTIQKPNEIWRRITGIFPDAKITLKERRRGLRFLARRIENRLKHNAVPESEPRASASGEMQIGFEFDWNFPAANWIRVSEGGVSVEQLCFELGCSPSRLTSLLKEYCGLSASEFVDGLKFSRLQKALAVRLRAAAEELWGFPGAFVAVKLSVSSDLDSTQRREGAKTLRTERRAEKRSRYFRLRPEEMFAESRADERSRRVLELCWRLSENFDLESWAINCGFGSSSKLKRACLNVSGRSLAQIERTLASEIVQFYLCAEDRELREIACSDEASVLVARAREVYHGDDEKPVAPFVDQWAKFEELKAHWLSKLKEIFSD